MMTTTSIVTGSAEGFHTLRTLTLSYSRVSYPNINTNPNPGQVYGSFRLLMNAGCAGKTVRSPRTRAILERLRGVFTTRRYTNTRLPYIPNPTLTRYT